MSFLDRFRRKVYEVEIRLKDAEKAQDKDLQEAQEKRRELLDRLVALGVEADVIVRRK